MKKLLLIVCFIVVSQLSYSQCPMFYIETNFTKVEYYSVVQGKLKLLEKTNSNNTFELLKNSSGNEGDMFAITGNLLGKYVQFIKQWKCKIDGRLTDYTFYTSDDRTNDIWHVSVVNGAIFKVSNINEKNNIIIEFTNY